MEGKIVSSNNRVRRVNGEAGIIIAGSGPTQCSANRKWKSAPGDSIWWFGRSLAGTEAWSGDGRVVELKPTGHHLLCGRFTRERSMYQIGG